MRLDLFKTIIIVLIGALLAWGFSEMCINQKAQIAMLITMWVIFIYCGITMSLKNEQYPRATVNARIVSALTLGILIGLNGVYCFVGSFSLAVYIIPNAIILLLSALIYRNIITSKV